MKLKEALASTPVLVYPNFEDPFVIETNVCEVGIEIVLSQHKHPIAYFSWKLSLLQWRASTYSKELLAITELVNKWRLYLLDTTFTIQIVHRSLKNLLTQAIQSLEKQYFLTRLLGFSFLIVYKKGKDNIATLSQSLVLEGEDKVHLTLFCSGSNSDWADKIWINQLSDPWVNSSKTHIWKNDIDLDYSVKEDILYYKGQFWLGPTSNIRRQILDELHSTRGGGHSRYF